MHPCPDNWVAIGRAVVYYARPAHVFCAEIKCQHCRCFHRSLTTVLAFNTCTKCVGCPGIKHDCTPDCHPDFWTWRPPQVPASQPNSALICKLLESLMCFAYFLKCYPWFFVQPGVGISLRPYTKGYLTNVSITQEAWQTYIQLINKVSNQLEWNDREWCPFMISLMINSNHFYLKLFSFGNIHIFENKL